MPALQRSRDHLNNYITGELFCGAGGLSRGFHRAGFRSKFANDAWPIALHTFLMNFDTGYFNGSSRQAVEVLPLPGSVEQLTASEILRYVRRDENSASLLPRELDVLLGGPPCQGFSVNSHTRSAQDPRNHLFRQYLRLLHGLAPKVFVLENVPGMLSLEAGKFFDELLMGFGSAKAGASIGYDVRFKILNAAHYGVPQERFRIVVVGTRKDVSDSVGVVDLPVPQHYSFARAHFKGGRSHTFHYAIGHRPDERGKVIPLFKSDLLSPVSVQDAIGDLPTLKNGGGADLSEYSNGVKNLTNYQREMRNGASSLTNHWCRELCPPNTERVKFIPPGGDWRAIPRSLLPPGMQRALRKDHTTRYGRLSPDGISGTLLTKPDPHWGTFLHYDLKQQRLISVREAARIQSFPDTHVFYGSQVDQYKLCGNAVPPNMAHAIAIRVKEILDNYTAKAAGRTRKLVRNKT